MRKRKKGRKLSRKRDQRKALLKTLATSLILRGKIKTTEGRAKELVKFVEKQISRAKTDNVQSRRMLSGVFSKETVKKLMTEVAPKYQARKGGYTRQIKLGPRKSDSAKRIIVELIK